MSDDFDMKPIAAWSLRAIIAHLPDGREVIEQGLRQDILVRMLGSIMVRIEWRNRRKPAEGHVFTQGSVSINDALLTIVEPHTVHTGRARSIENGLTLDRVVRFEGLPGLPAIPITGSRYLNGESDCILDEMPTIRFSEVMR
jgi:hypothetical protein